MSAARLVTQSRLTFFRCLPGQTRRQPDWDLPKITGGRITEFEILVGFACCLRVEHALCLVNAASPQLSPPPSRLSSTRTAPQFTKLYVMLRGMYHTYYVTSEYHLRIREASLRFKQYELNTLRAASMLLGLAVTGEIYKVCAITPIRQLFVLEKV